MNELYYLIAKVMYLQKTIVSWLEKYVPKQEKVSLAEVARLNIPDEMGDF